VSGSIYRRTCGYVASAGLNRVMRRGSLRSAAFPQLLHCVGLRVRKVWVHRSSNGHSRNGILSTLRAPAMGGLDIFLRLGGVWLLALVTKRLPQTNPLEVIS